MGNENKKGYEYQYIPSDTVNNLKLGTIFECAEHSNHLRCSGYGNTPKEAIEDLRKQCIFFNIPEPQLVPGCDSKWYCGTFETVWLFKKERKYNTVWFNKKNNYYMAFAFGKPIESDIIN